MSMFILHFILIGWLVICACTWSETLRAQTSSEPSYAAGKADNKRRAVQNVIAFLHDRAQTDLNANMNEEAEPGGPDTENLSADLTGDLSDRLDHYLLRPIHINRLPAQAIIAQLKELVFLSDANIDALSTHIITKGKLVDPLELQSVVTYESDIITLLLPFITIADQQSAVLLTNKQLKQAITQEIHLRYGRILEQQKGFRNTEGRRYLGSADRTLVKYKLKAADKLSFSLTADKDAGERWLDRNIKSGADFLTASLAIYKTSVFSKLILGDYSLQFGEGLSLWTGNAFARGPDVAGIAKRPGGLKPYSGTSETAFLRGLATERKLFRSTVLTAFISKRKLDASVKISPEGNRTVQSINESGLHRTVSEIANRGSLSQTLFGVNIQYQNKHFEANIVGYRTMFNHNFIRGSQLYRQRFFEGKQLNNLGFNSNYVYKSMYIFTELAKSIPAGTAVLTGAITPVSRELSGVVVYRNYSPEYHSFYTQSIGSGSLTTNERAVYIGLHYRPGTKTEGFLYLDLVKFPSPKFRIDHPSREYRMSSGYIYRIRKSLKVAGRLSATHSEQNGFTPSNDAVVMPVIKLNSNLLLNWKLTRKFDFSNRIFLSFFRKGSDPGSTGFMVCQDASFTPMNHQFSGGVRLAYFNAPVYENRIYSYEDNMPYGATSGMYYGRGIRAYSNLEIRLRRSTRIWLRYGLNYYPGEEAIGSDLNVIKGPKKSDFQILARYQF